MNDIITHLRNASRACTDGYECSLSIREVRHVVALLAEKDAEIARLREALTPFATTAEQLDRDVKGARSQTAEFFRPFIDADDEQCPIDAFPIPDDAALLYAMRWHDPHAATEVIGLEMRHFRNARAALAPLSPAPEVEQFVKALESAPKPAA